MKCISVVLRNRIVGIVGLIVALGLSGCAVAPLAMIGTAASVGVGVSVVSSNLPEGVEVELSAPDGGVLASNRFKELNTVVTNDRYVHAFMNEERKGLFATIKKTTKQPLTERSAAKLAKQNGVGAFLWVKFGGMEIDKGLFSGAKQISSYVTTVVDVKDRVLYKQTVTIKQKFTTFGENKMLTKEDVGKLLTGILVNDFKRGKGLEVANVE